MKWNSTMKNKCQKLSGDRGRKKNHKCFMFDSEVVVVRLSCDQ